MENKTNNIAVHLAKWREENPEYKIQRLNPVEKAKANPKSKTLAIKAFCWECCGGDKEEVKTMSCSSLSFVPSQTVD